MSSLSSKFIEEYQKNQMEAYYQIHAKIYAQTRWTFLFGRKSILRDISKHLAQKDAPVIMEIGCGTGYNLKALESQFPTATLIGVDISETMLKIASKNVNKARVTLISAAYGNMALEIKPDLILFSYCLTMVNPGYQMLLAQAYQDLPKDGIIAVVDFHRSGFRLFRHWMRFNHVQMEGQLVPKLVKKYQVVKLYKTSAYFGLWSYFTFIGVKRK
jgi:S-adenosylmethionine-diacylgycerolhomoserine-N-methlytransferase